MNNQTKLLLEKIVMENENTDNLISITGNFTKITSHPDHYFPMPGRILVNDKDDIIYIETHGQGILMGVETSNIKKHIEIKFKGNNGKLYKREKIIENLTQII